MNLFIALIISPAVESYDSTLASGTNILETEWKGHSNRGMKMSKVMLQTLVLSYYFYYTLSTTNITQRHGVHLVSRLNALDVCIKNWIADYIYFKAGKLGVKVRTGSKLGAKLIRRRGMFSVSLI